MCFSQTVMLLMIRIITQRNLFDTGNRKSLSLLVFLIYLLNKHYSYFTVLLKQVVLTPSDKEKKIKSTVTK